MTTESDDEILDSLFHGCAVAAYVDQAVQQQGPPDSVATRQRAYAYYEQALAEKNRRKTEWLEQGKDRLWHAPLEELETDANQD